MKNNYTHINFVIDRSGSMMTISDDMNGGLQNLLKDQKNINGECTVSLYQFDDRYEPVFEMVEIDNVPEYKLVPRGGTALNDAIGRSINILGDSLSKMSESDRPEKVMFVIVTDGYENSSKEFLKPQIKEMIERQTNEYNWQFIFLGAGIDTFNESFDYGVMNGSKMNVKKSSDGAKNMFASLSEKFSTYRGMSSDQFRLPNNANVRAGAFFDENDRNKQV
jgi:uncharacterized protein YegL